MAREAHDREDLLRDATAYVDRILLSVPDWYDEIVVGFRRNGACSLYFDQQFVIQFNHERQLRRIYVDDEMYVATNGVLENVRRVSFNGRVELQSQSLDEDVAQDLQRRVSEHLTQLKRTLAAGTFAIRGEVAANSSSVMDRVSEWLQSNTDYGTADRPNA